MMMGKSSIRKPGRARKSTSTNRVRHPRSITRTRSKNSTPAPSRQAKARYRAAALKDKYSRVFRRAGKKKTALAANEAQTAARLKTYEEKRQSLVTETEAWQTRHQEDLKVKLAKQLESLRISTKPRMKEIETATSRKSGPRKALEGRPDRSLQADAGIRSRRHPAHRLRWEGTNWEMGAAQ